jgi:hypothetical protein
MLPWFAGAVAAPAALGGFTTQSLSTAILGGGVGAAGSSWAYLRFRWRKSDAARWFQGAAGERRTHRAVRKLRLRGWHLLNDRSIPGSRANLDHVWVSPTSDLVFVGDTKAWHAKGARVKFSGGRLWYGRWDETDKVETIRWETSKVLDVLGGSFTRRVVSVLVLDGAILDADHHPQGWLEIDPRFYVVEQPHLAKFLSDSVHGQRRHSAAAAHLAMLIGNAFPAYRRASGPRGTSASSPHRRRI